MGTTTTEVMRATGREPSPPVDTATARTWDTTTRQAVATPSTVEEGTTGTQSPVLVRGQGEDALQTGTLEDWGGRGSLAAPATPGLAVQGGMLEKEAVLGLWLPEDFLARREAVGVEVEKAEVTGKDLEVDLMDEGEVGTGPLEGEVVAELEERGAGEGREANQSGLMEEEAGEEGDGEVLAPAMGGF